MTKKETIRLIIFCIILAAIIGWMLTVFTYPSGYPAGEARERFNTFYALPDDSIDGVFLGTSAAGWYFVSPQAYADKGLKIMNLGTGTQPVALTKYMMKETLKSQKNIKLFVVDLRGISVRPDQYHQVAIRRITDNMRISLNKFQATKGMMDYLDGVNNRVKINDLSYYIKFIKYHSSWRDIPVKEYIHPFPETEFMGYHCPDVNPFVIKPFEKPQLTADRAPLEPRNEEMLNELLDYCDELNKKGIQVLFVSSPYVIDYERAVKINEAADIITERGYTVLDFNSEEKYNELDVDFKTDFYHEGHMNIKGAVKYTDYLSNYIITNCFISDKRDGEKYKEWEDAQKRLIAKTKKKWPEVLDILAS